MISSFHIKTAPSRENFETKNYQNEAEAMLNKVKKKSRDFNNNFSRQNVLKGRRRLICDIAGEFGRTFSPMGYRVLHFERGRLSIRRHNDGSYMHGLRMPR